MVIYVAERGETIDDIARKFGLAPEAISRENGIAQNARIVTGESFVITPEGNVHQVTEGETIAEIARNYGESTLELYLLNPQIEDIRNLQGGDQIFLPLEPKLGLITVNGYCYPNIEQEILDTALPNLTYLCIFSYEIRPDGSLVPIQDEAIIEDARQKDTAPKMVITNIDENGGFSGELGHIILENEEVQDTLIENIIEIMEQKQYSGLDIDLEYLFPEDRELYNSFLKRISETLHALGYTVTSAVAPKLSEEQKGTLYEAHDYAAHGEYLDYVILMTYEWGYTYGPPMAVAPIDQVRRVLDYAVTVIPSKKILLGIPNYGYDWQMPYTEGTAARSLTNTQAVELAQQYESIILYNTISQSPYFYYLDEENGNAPHVVWFEDARSIQAKLELVTEYNLGGVSYWTVNRAFPQNWTVLRSMYDIRKIL